MTPWPFFFTAYPRVNSGDTTKRLCSHEIAPGILHRAWQADLSHEMVQDR